MCCGAGLFPLSPFQYGVEFELGIKRNAELQFKRKKIKRNMGFV